METSHSLSSISPRTVGVGIMEFRDSERVTKTASSHVATMSSSRLLGSIKEMRCPVAAGLVSAPLWVAGRKLSRRR
jgi:hypothetical protein